VVSAKSEFGEHPGTCHNPPNATGVTNRPTLLLAAWFELQWDEESRCLSGEVDPPLDGHKIESGSMVALRCKRGETGLSHLIHLTNAYRSSIHENKARASDSVIHPHFFYR
jgi:hypothetical protein